MRLRTRAMIAIGAILIVGAGLVTWHLLRARPPGLQPESLPTVMPLTATDRVLIIAPHCDDEVLGAGGLLHDAVAIGATVRVALITNGDGFRYAVETEEKTLRATPAQYVQFALLRQAETLAATSSLGLPPGQVTFLGYPDRGIAELWGAYWPADNPYRSLFTHYRVSPYENSYTPNAPYTGTQLAQDLMRLLREFRPTIIVYPHPSDAHTDHWSSNAFVTYALQQLQDQNEAWAATMQRYLYLVHRGQWPLPRGEHLQNPLLPPRTLVGSEAHWFLRPLTAETVTAKRDAILLYHTQTTLMRSYLLSFARETEVFGTIDPALVPATGLGRVVDDPAEDTVVRLIDPGADLLAVDVGHDATNLTVRVTLRGAPTTAITYALRLVALTASPTGERLSVELLVTAPGAVVVGSASSSRRTAATASASERQITYTVPLRELGAARHVLLSVATVLEAKTADQTAMRLLDLTATP